MASADQGGSWTGGNASRPTHRPLQLAGRSSASSGGARQAPSPRRAGPSSRMGAERTGRGLSSRRQSGTHVRRTRYGYPTVSERLAKGVPRGAGRSGVIGSTVQHNGSLGYIRKGPFGGSARQRAARSHILHVLPYALGIIAAILLVWGVGTAVQTGWGPFGKGSAEEPEPAASAQALASVLSAAPSVAAIEAEVPSSRVIAPAATTAGAGRVTFSAVGDNFVNDVQLVQADAASGESGDGAYDFSGLYSGLRDVLAASDVAFISQATPLTGADQNSASGVAPFATPDSLADAIVGAGWDVVALASANAFDAGDEGITHALSVWNGKGTDILTTGSFSSAADRNAVRAATCNGVDIAFLSYWCPDDGATYDTPSEDFYLVRYDAETMRADVARAREVADVVVVSLWGGAAYAHDPSDAQRTRAQELADAGVDVVLGCGTRVIQPVEWVEGAGGRTLVAFGLGDLVSADAENVDAAVSLMLTCDFTKLDAEEASASGRSVAIENIVLRPLVDHREAGSETIYPLAAYTDEQARANELLTGISDPHLWVSELSRRVLGTNFDIAL